MVSKLIFRSALIGFAVLYAASSAASETGYFYLTCDVKEGEASQFAVSSPFAFQYELPPKAVESEAGFVLGGLPVREIVEMLVAQGKTLIETSEILSEHHRQFIENDLPEIRDRVRDSFGHEFEEAVLSQLGSPCVKTPAAANSRNGLKVFGPARGLEEASDEVRHNIDAIAVIHQSVRSIDIEPVEIEFNPSLRR